MAYPQELKALFKAFLSSKGNGGAVSAHSYDTFPDNDDITLTVEGVADVYGDWVNVVTSNGAVASWTTALYVSNPTIATDYKVDIGTGATGSETRKLTVPYHSTALATTVSSVVGTVYNFPFPIYMPTLTNISGREKVGATAGAVDIVEVHAIAL
jgi:hypothetical protein